MEEENQPQNPQEQKTGTPGSVNPEVSVHKIPVIRTYEHDIAELMAQKKISSASISIAEADARRKETTTATTATPPLSSPPPAPPNKPINQSQSASRPVQHAHASNSGKSVVKSIFKLILSLVLITLGVWGGYYLYTISPFTKEFPAEIPATTTENTSLIPSIITPDTQKIVDISNDTGQETLSALSALQKSNTAGILGIVFEETYASSTVQVTAPEFITNINMNPPNAFTTSLNSQWMLGYDDTTPFIIFTTNFFQNTFAGMLAWEPTMSEDFTSLFGLTANTTGKYEDRILDNKNIREFVSASGTPLFLYGFIDNQTLVIARSEPTFSDIVNRIENQTYVR